MISPTMNRLIFKAGKVAAPTETFEGHPNNARSALICSRMRPLRSQRAHSRPLSGHGMSLSSLSTSAMAATSTQPQDYATIPPHCDEQGSSKHKPQCTPALLEGRHTWRIMELINQFITTYKPLKPLNMVFIQSYNWFLVSTMTLQVVSVFCKALQDSLKSHGASNLPMHLCSHWPLCEVQQLQSRACSQQHRLAQ